MKDVRPVAVHQDARLVVLVVGVAADMAAPVDQEHAPAGIAGQALGRDAAGEARADDQVIESHVALDAAAAPMGERLS